MVSTLPNTLQTHVLIKGEKATPPSQLPPIWQAIAQNQADVGLGPDDRQAYVHLAQLFLYRCENGDVDLFQERPQLKRFQPMFGQLLGPLAWETLAFYGEDFLRDRYPNFPQLFSQAQSQFGPHSDAAKVAQIGLDLFAEFGYSLPASFYEVHLAPLDRDHIFEERALRYDPRDQGHKRPWDAMLHACKVFAIQMKLQSIASQQGFTYQHGCACNSHLSNIDLATGAFDYAIAPEKRQRWLRSFLWTAWYEYALFDLIPTTAYLA